MLFSWPSLTINIMRPLPVFLLLAVVGCLVSPFLLTAWLREHRGVDITGTVARKQETVWHSSSENDITRSAIITVSYVAPGRSWPEYRSVNLPLERYDQINRGDVLRMRYLLERDLPDYPLLHSLYRSGFLPVTSVDGRSIFTIGQDLIPELPLRLMGSVTALILVLWLWFKLRIPGGVFAIAVCILGALGLVIFSEFPRPLSPLQGVVLLGKATVQNNWIVDKIYNNGPSRSSWSLDQPVQYVMFEFVPEGRRESVVAADKIDAGSILNFKLGQSLAVQYERATPRSARLIAGTRTYWKKNLRGLAISAFMWIVLGGLALALWGVFHGRFRANRTATSA